jgi:hypothetical protein
MERQINDAVEVTKGYAFLERDKHNYLKLVLFAGF